MVAVVVGASVAATAIHYTDNYISIEDYPQPGWIAQETIYVVWILFTLIGIAGYLFFRDEKPVAAAAYLLVYSYTGLSSLGHYAYGSIEQFSSKMHLLIALDGIAGAAVALCAAWIIATRKAAQGRGS